MRTEIDLNDVFREWYYPHIKTLHSDNKLVNVLIFVTVENDQYMEEVKYYPSYRDLDTGYIFVERAKFGWGLGTNHPNLLSAGEEAKRLGIDYFKRKCIYEDEHYKGETQEDHDNIADEREMSYDYFTNDDTP